MGEMGAISKRMPRFSASARASWTLPSDEKGPGMPTPVTLRAPSASTAMAAVSEESMPPLSPMSTRSKPHLRM